MKVMVASDIHGSLASADAVIEAFAREKADKLILLGDLYYHGPRNPLPESYMPAAVAERFNAFFARHAGFIAVRGNCDAEVDAMISDFPFVDRYRFALGDKTVLCVHGHREPEQEGADVVLRGHSHVAGITEGAPLTVNPGSATLPKENTARGYAILTENGIALKTLDGETYARRNL